MMGFALCKVYIAGEAWKSQHNVDYAGRLQVLRLHQR
jgi:hypothetical protein